MRCVPQHTLSACQGEKGKYVSVVVKDRDQTADTQDGRTLGLDSSEEMPHLEDGLHLYKEITPVSPLIASRLNAMEFFDLIVKNPTSLVTLPSIAYVELRLDELAEDPEMGQVGCVKCLKTLKPNRLLRRWWTGQAQRPFLIAQLRMDSSLAMKLVLRIILYPPVRSCARNTTAGGGLQICKNLSLADPVTKAHAREQS